jgi:hypothetical protein
MDNAEIGDPIHAKRALRLARGAVSAQVPITMPLLQRQRLDDALRPRRASSGVVGKLNRPLVVQRALELAEYRRRR